MWDICTLSPQPQPCAWYQTQTVRTIQLVCYDSSRKTRDRCDLSSRVRHAIVVLEDMEPLEDGHRSCNVIAIGKHVRPPRYSSFRCSPRFQCVVMSMTMPVGLFSRGRETRPTAPGRHISPAKLKSRMNPYPSKKRMADPSVPTDRPAASTGGRDLPRKNSCAAGSARRELH